MTNLVKELLGLLAEAEEATARSFELEEIVKTFKNKNDIEKHLNKLWGSKHLTFRGQPFFSGNDWGPVYKGCDKAGQKALKADDSIQTNLELENESREAYLDVDSMQEVYLGYSVTNDMLYIGFDMWMRDEGFEQPFEDMYEDAFGEPFDDSSDEMNARWKKFKDANPAFYGGLVELSSKDGKRFEADVLVTEPGGFYKGVHDSQIFKSMKLIDLRLD